MASNLPSCINPCKNTRNDSWSCCSLIGHKKTKVLWHQSEARTTPTVWNWSGKTVSPGAPRFVLYFSSPKFFFARYDFPLAPTNCPWVSEDGLYLGVVHEKYPQISPSKPSSCLMKTLSDQVQNKVKSDRSKIGTFAEGLISFNISVHCRPYPWSKKC